MKSLHGFDFTSYTKNLVNETQLFCVGDIGRRQEALAAQSCPRPRTDHGGGSSPGR